MSSPILQCLSALVFDKRKVCRSAVCVLMTVDLDVLCPTLLVSFLLILAPIKESVLKCSVCQ